MAKLKVGIVSAAWGAAAHLPAWRTLEDVEVVGICTSRRETAEAAARTFGVERPYWSVEDMGASDIDVIDVGTRPVLRQQLAMTALEHGKHVYAGMPFAADVAHAEALRDRQAAAGVVGVVDAYIQAIPAVALLKQQLAEGLIGDLQAVRCRFDLSLFSPHWIGVPTYAWFADRTNGASALRNLGGHALHALVHLFGEAEAVVGSTAIRVAEWPAADGSVIRPETDDTAMAQLAFRSGLMAQLFASWAGADGQGFEIDVRGSEGRLLATAPPNFPESFTTELWHTPLGGIGRGLGGPGGGEPRRLAIPERLKTVDRSSARADEPRNALFAMARLFRGLVDAVHAGGEAQPSFRQALHVQRIVEAVYRSEAERRWVEVAPL